MKHTLILFLLSVLLISCDDILFEKPQPDWLKNEKLFPERIQGRYASDHDTIAISSDRITPLNSKDENPIVLSDSVILRCEGNNYFVNLRADNKWIIWLGKNDGKQIILYQLPGNDETVRKSVGEITAIKRIKKDAMGDSVDTYIINPTGEEFKKILSKNLFKKAATYRKI